MHSLIPLIFILIAFNSRQLKQDSLYRANVFSLVGFCYFFYLQYTIYWFNIFPTESYFQYIPGILGVLLITGILLTPWAKNSHLTKTLCCCILFLVALVLTYGFDYEVKEKLAEIGGYYDLPETNTAGSQPNKPQKNVDLAKIGMSIQFTKNWISKETKSDHEYFELILNDKKTVEVRPNCFGRIDIDTPTYVQNMFSFFEVDTFKTQHYYRCLIEGGEKKCLIVAIYPSSSNIKERWHWFRLDEKRQRSVGLDILFFNNDEIVKEQALKVVESTKLLRAGPDEPCITPSEWM